VTPDGSQVFFTSYPNCGSYPRVYMRAGGHTTEISASQCTRPDCGPEGEVRFVGRSGDGSTVFLTTAQQLTDGDTNTEQDIYRYDIASGELSLLFERPAGANATELIGVRPSRDGSRVFFRAEGQLLPPQGVAGEPNLYFADQNGLQFVAHLPIGEYNWVSPFKASADCRYAILFSAAPLAAGDTDSAKDLYRYDAVTHTYTRISAGVGGRGNGAFDVNFDANSPVDIGARIFFTTDEQLLPQDQNAKADIYEWTAAGLDLVSAGTPSFAGEYEGVTPDGATVLFRTGATLLPRDRDGGELDIYAARIGGGFPEPVVQSPCGEACEALPGARPKRPPLGSGERKRRLELAPLDAAVRRELLTTGATTLLAEVPRAGTLSAQGKAKIGLRPESVAVGSAKADEAGPVRLRLRLTQPARRALAHGKSLRVRLRLSLSGYKGAQRSAFTLRGKS